MNRFTLMLLACVLSGCARDEPLQRFEFRSRKMASQVRLIAYGPGDSVVERAVRAAFARMEQIDSLLSDYRGSSEVSRLAAAQAGEPMPASVELMAVMKVALQLSRETDGAFDVTVGPVTQLWRGARRRDTIPDRATVCKALGSTGWQHVALDTIAHTIRFAVSGMRMDFGGIAKGYAADEALAELRRHGVSRALIEFGGEIVASDAPPGEQGWPVSVAGVANRLLIANGAVSTSGDTEQFTEVGGVRYSHVIDPRTGVALSSRVDATVRAPTGILADGLATSATVLDSLDAMRVIAMHGDASLVRRAADPATGAGARQRQTPPHPRSSHQAWPAPAGSCSLPD